MFSRRALVRFLLPVCVWIPLGTCGSMVSWVTQSGAPQIAMQDDATGQIFHSLCNSNETAVFPPDGSAAFNPTIKPKRNTSLAAAGYYDGIAHNIVSLWYQSEETGGIVQASFTCDDEGHYQPNGQQDRIVSTSAPSVHPSTGLSAVLLGAVAGYRVFYQRSDETLAYLTFTNDDGWSSAGVVSQDTARSALTIASGYTDTESITVVTPKDDRNIEVSALEDDSWHITTFPRPLAPTGNQTNATGASVTDETRSRDIRLDGSQNVTWSLPAWDGAPGNLGVAFDSEGTRSVFYIGTDRMLHSVIQTASGWRRASGQDDSVWPLADQPSAPFAITSDFGQNKIWIHYMSGGGMTQVHASDSDTWEPAIKLPQTPPPPEQIPPSAPQGLSTGAKAGIGVGASVGGLAITAAIAFLFFVRRRRSARRRRDAEADAVTQATTADIATPTSPDLVRPGTDLDVEAKADENPRELPGQERSHELEDRLPTQELPGDWRYPESKKEDAAGN